MCLEPRSSSWLGSWAVDPHSCARRCVVLGVTPGRDQGGAGSPEEARTWLGPGRAAGSWGHCCLSRPPVPALDWTSLRLGSLSEPEGGGAGGTEHGAGRDHIPGSVLTPCLVSRPRGAVLHVDRRSERRSGPWGRLQGDRPLQVSPAHRAAWAPAVCQDPSPSLPCFRLHHPLREGMTHSPIS